MHLTAFACTQELPSRRGTPLTEIDHVDRDPTRANGVPERYTAPTCIISSSIELSYRRNLGIRVRISGTACRTSNSPFTLAGLFRVNRTCQVRWYSTRMKLKMKKYLTLVSVRVLFTGIIDLENLC